MVQISVFHCSSIRGEDRRRKSAAAAAAKAGERDFASRGGKLIRGAEGYGRKEAFIQLVTNGKGGRETGKKGILINLWRSSL